jgi:hypothetical protein
MHLQVGILAQRLQLHQGFAIAGTFERFAHFGAAIAAGRPASGNDLGQLFRRSALAKRLAQIRALSGV